jgi:hypothetical protein
MPPELGQQIADLSASNRRPMNTTIILLLESAMKERNRKKKKHEQVHIQDNTPD